MQLIGLYQLDENIVRLSIIIIILQIYYRTLSPAQSLICVLILYLHERRIAARVLIINYKHVNTTLYINIYIYIYLYTSIYVYSHNRCYRCHHRHLRNKSRYSQTINVPIVNAVILPTPLCRINIKSYNFFPRYCCCYCRPENFCAAVVVFLSCGKARKSQQLFNAIRSIVYLSL